MPQAIPIPQPTKKAKVSQNLPTNFPDEPYLKAISVAPRKSVSGNSNLAQCGRAFNIILAEASSSSYLLLDGFPHTERCASLWKFAVSVSSVKLAVDTRNDDEPFLDLHATGVEIHLFEYINQEKLLDLNQQLGRYPEQLPPELNTQERPIAIAIYEQRLLTSKYIRVGDQFVNRPREPELLPADQIGVTQMLSSLRPALTARAKGIDARKISLPEDPSDAS